MAIRATCHECGKDFYFQQLARADARDADRCPNCSTSLGIVNVRNSTAEADRLVAELARVLRTISQREPHFSIVESSVLSPLEDAMGGAATPVAPEPRRRFLFPRSKAA